MQVTNGVTFFPKVSKPSEGHTQPSLQWVEDVISQDKKAPGHEISFSTACGAEVKKSVCACVVPLNAVRVSSLLPHVSARVSTVLCFWFSTYRIRTIVCVHVTWTVPVNVIQYYVCPRCVEGAGVVTWRRAMEHEQFRAVPEFLSQKGIEGGSALCRE
jgi:hypothetical protein